MNLGPPPGGPPTLGALLRAHRERALLTQEELAERAGLSARTIVGLETGRVRRPRTESVRLLADTLGLAGAERAAFTAAATGSDPADLVVPVAPVAPVAPPQHPADPAGFVGRVGYLRMLDGLLPGGPRSSPGMAVVSGTAGVGKTALALHWAYRARGHFPDGQLYVSLRGWTPGPPLRPVQALTQLLRGLGVAPELIPVDTEAAAALYRTMLSDRRALVLLDDARDVEQVRPLLPAGPGCLAVVTSRSRLAGLVAREGARRIALDVLAADEARVLLASQLGRARVAAEPGPADELAAACGHLPLPLRIVAAKLADHPGRAISQLVAELLEGDPLAVLEVEGDERSAVRATLRLSYNSLPPQARRQFRLLGLMPGHDVTPAAAAALAGLEPSGAGALLERLADASLIASPVPGRFALHDLLRVYAAERTEAEDPPEARAAARARLLDWYLQMADAAARLLYPDKLRLALPDTDGPTAAGFGDRDQALAWLDAERPNLVAAVEQAAEQGSRSFAWRLSDTLRGYFWLRMATLEWLAVARAGLAAAEADGDLLGQGAAELSLGDVHRCQSRYAEAIGHYLRARARNQEAGWVDGQAAALGNLGNVYWRAGRLREAAEQHTLALALDQETGRLAGQAASLANLGTVNRELGRLEEAAGHLTQALELDDRIGSEGGRAMDLTNLGEVLLALGRRDEADRHLREALALHRDLGDRDSEADTLRVLAVAGCETGRGDAAELAQAALCLARDTGNLRLQADALNTLALVHRRLGEPAEAARAHQQALEVARRAPERHPEVAGLVGLALARLDLGDVDGARCQAEQALALARQAGYRLLEGQAGTALAAARRAAGRLGPAADQARQALAVHRETGHRPGEHHTLAVLTEIEAAAADLDLRG